MSWKSTETKVKKGPYRAIVVALCLMLFTIVPIMVMSGGFGYIQRRYINPMFASADRMAFEETRNYNVGNREELRRLKKEYDLADEDSKEILSQYILAQFNEMDWNTLPSDLKTFLESL